MPKNVWLEENKTANKISIHLNLSKFPLEPGELSFSQRSFLSSMVKYVNKMSKVILQRGTKEKRGDEGGGEAVLKCLPFSITLARGGPASRQSGTAGEHTGSIESHISPIPHTQKNMKYLFSLSHQRASLSLLVTELSHTFWFPPRWNPASCRCFGRDKVVRAFVRVCACVYV